MNDVPREEGVESALEKVRQRLYTPQAPVVEAVPEHASMRVSAERWQPEAQVKKKLSATAWFFVIAFGFFIIAGIAALLILFLGGRSVGNDRMSITFESPVTVGGGEEVPFDLVIENENPIEADDVLLSIDFPPEAFNPTTMQPLNHYSASLENLTPGASVRHSVPVTFFGSEDQKITVAVTLEYRTPNSSAVFVKEESRDLTIATAPLSIRITTPPDVSSGQTVTVSASVRSNADEVLKDVAVKAEYPFGFTVISTDPAPVGANVFVLGDLTPGEEKDVSITGTLIGENDDERVFRFSGGVLSAPGATTLRTPAFTLATKDITISRSFLAADLSLNQQKENIVASPGETLSGLITWVNSLASTVRDAELRITLSGDALNLNSVGVANGFYRSSDKTIVFDESTESGLRSLSPGESGAGAFTVEVKDANALRALQGPSATFAVSVSGRREEDGRTENLTSTLTRSVRIGTDFTLTADAVHTVGPFENSGPLPPQAEKETTYTVRLSVKNTLNAVANATVTAKLPSYVRYTNIKDPSSITYDEQTRTVTWALGEVVPGVTREGAFQIALTPSTAQRGTAPDILTDITAHGFDRFVQEDVGEELDPLTTELYSDPGFRSDDDLVQ